MTKAITYTYSAAQEYRKYIAYAFICASMVMAIIYGFNIYSVISRTIATERLEARTASLQGTVQELDARYISLSDKVTPDAAKSFGLHETAVTAYIPKTPSLGRVILSMKEM